MVDIIRNNNELVFHLDEEIDITQAAHLRKVTLQEIEEGHYHLVFDFARTKYIDSTGLGVLIAAQKRVSAHGYNVKVRHVKGSVKELFELTRLDNVFEFTDEDS